MKSIISTDEDGNLIERTSHINLEELREMTKKMLQTAHTIQNCTKKDQRRKTPKIKVKTRRFFQGRKEMREILEVNALRPSELPSEYLSEFPHVYFLGEKEGVSNRLVVFWTQSKQCILLEKDNITESEFQSILHTINLAGEKLAGIHFPKWKEEIFEI